MKLENQRMTAGLIFERRQTCKLHEALPFIRAALDMFDVSITGQTKVSDTCAILQIDERLVRVTLNHDFILPSSDKKPRQILHLCIKDRAFDNEGPASDVLMVEMTTRLHAALRPSHVMWRDAAILTSEEFADILSEQSDPNSGDQGPPTKKTNFLPPIDESHTPLQARFEKEARAMEVASLYYVMNNDLHEDAGLYIDGPEPPGPWVEEIRDPSNSSRLAAWVLSIGVSTVALPLGAALMTVNLIKGENLRLVSQCAALLGLFSALNASGASAETLMVVENLLG